MLFVMVITHFDNAGVTKFVPKSFTEFEMSCSRNFEAEYSITKQHMSICFSFGSLIDIDNEFDCELSSIHLIKVRNHKFD